MGVSKESIRMKRGLPKSPKKSETLEVRISYETKQDLSKRAETENRTVSDVVRTLIETYLANPARGTEPLPSGDAAMRFKHLILEKPKTVLASLAVILGSSLFFMPIANAEPFTLDMQGEYTEFGVEGPDSKRVRRFETQMELDFGSTIVMSMNGQIVSDKPVLTQDGMWLKVKVDEADMPDGEKSVLIVLSVIDKVNETETIVAQPRLTAAYDKTASFISETETQKYSFKFSPRSKS